MICGNCTLFAAFTNTNLLDGRWLIGEMPKDARVRESHLWTAILTIDESKQLLFLHRVLALHDIARRRGGKSANSRLTSQEWPTELDRMAIAGHALDQMEKMTNTEGDKIFDASDLRSVHCRVLEGCLAGVNQ